jgi:histidyl-tRNA synthetase
LGDEAIAPPEEPGLAVFVVAIGAEARVVGRELVRVLRGAGVAADASFEDRPLKAQLRSADRTGAAFAAILGERELGSGVVTMRRLADGDQREVAVTDVVDWLSTGADA